MATDKALKGLQENLKVRFVSTAHILWGREINELLPHELYMTVAATIKQYITENWIKTNKAYMDNKEKQVYYFSIEFLLGRLLRSNLLNLGLLDLMKETLQELGINLDELYKEEPEPGLGNGGLGRLAACFIDSMAALGIPGHGCSIRYQYGLFEQKIIQGNQVEIPDNWLRHGFAWEYRKPDKAVDVRFNGDAYMRRRNDGSLELVHENYTIVRAVPYDVPIVGYKNHTVNTLRLWNAEVDVDFSEYGTLSQEELQRRNQYRETVEAITKYLYPDDSSYEGKKMRLVQEYFFVSAGVQSIVRHFKRAGMNIHDFAKKIAIHINDTHPAVAVAELMRILVDVEHLDWQEAWMITRNTMAYTNHTIMPEALEKWPVDMFKPLLPRIYMIIDEINRRFLERVRRNFPNDEQRVRELSIIQDGQIHMARLAVVGSHHVNGVAQIHSDILTRSTLRPFYEIMPEKFNNKTNGITHRRWLMSANRELSELIDEAISTKWRQKPDQLKLLMEYTKDKPFLQRLAEIKKDNKDRLAKFIQDQTGIRINPDSIFDIQVKRIHSYKRQLMNILHVMYQYRRLKYDSSYDVVPTTYFFGGKAAPGYFVAKETIRLINAVADKINHDRNIREKLRVVFIENFGVATGELVYPAADVSEQISTASKEASGTGNMKFMMNGAITLGTMDGANIEIHDAIGDEHCVIFGLRAEEVMAFYENGMYSAWDEYNRNRMVHDVVSELTRGTYGNFKSLFDYLLQSNDEFFIMKDFNSYARAHGDIARKYLDEDRWRVSSLVNIAQSGRFSSDRTINEYARDIWQVKKILIP